MSPDTRPNLILLAGPNGAGKTTASSKLLQGPLRVHEFVNADIIARGLSAFNPEKAAIEAGRVMLHRLRYLTSQRVNVAFESTLASRTFERWIAELVRTGYDFRLFYFWLPTPELAIARVHERVRQGGHFVPDETVRRRYEAGLRNFFELYRPLAATWRFFNNTDRTKPTPIASGGIGVSTLVTDASIWSQLEAQWADGRRTR